MKIFYSILFLLVLFFAGIVKAEPFPVYGLLGETPVNPNAGHVWGPYPKFPVLESASEIEGYLYAETGGTSLSACEASSQNLTCTWEIISEEPNIFDSELTNYVIELNGEISACPEGQTPFQHDQTVCTSDTSHDTPTGCANGYTNVNDVCYPDVSEDQCHALINQLPAGSGIVYSTQGSATYCGAEVFPEEPTAADNLANCTAAASFQNFGFCSTSPGSDGCGTGTFGTVNGVEVCVYDLNYEPPETDPNEVYEPFSTEGQGTTPLPVPGTSTTTENGTSTSTTTDNGDGTSTTTTTTTNTSTTNIDFDLPGFCAWATVVCEFFDWFTQEPGQSATEHPELPVEEVELEDWDSGLGSGSCPPPEITSFQGQSIEFSYENACFAASNVFYPLLMAFSFFAAGMILIGAKN